MSNPTEGTPTIRVVVTWYREAGTFDSVIEGTDPASVEVIVRDDHEETLYANDAAIEAERQIQDADDARDFEHRLLELRSAGRRVVDRWESGDLAEAVNLLRIELDEEDA